MCINYNITQLLRKTSNDLQNKITDPVEMKSICENLRSIYDYCIKDIGNKFLKKINYFPYTDFSKSENEDVFLKKELFKKAKGTKNSKGIPYRLIDLKNDYKLIYNLICSIQSFNGDSWLYTLFMITNHLKHEELLNIFDIKIGNIYIKDTNFVHIGKTYKVKTKNGDCCVAKDNDIIITNNMSPNQVLEQLNPELIGNSMIYVGDGAISFKDEIIDINMFLQKCYQNTNEFITELYKLF